MFALRQHDAKGWVFEKEKALRRQYKNKATDGKKTISWK
ncbi:hypothetical protein LEP1GSC058_1705 [Leptospira fainei serovar Hurstbridge str. BUT 6]|uniref:Uncharacterized protein n=1 Tax=Leptospira fainei serovar Hurstbridge str. BUT 6 TaxID=1193011 RepID=S3UWA1_9LEPT|nr:hypothetical protein LEP1GSC058_1705 [Leptospira fainei serovar Hurstbridge str. BUT 6]